MKTIYYSILLIFVATFLLSFEVSDSIEINETHALENIRQFNIEKLNEFKKDENFIYQNNSEYNIDFYNWLANKLESFFKWLFGDIGEGTGKTIAFILRFLMWALFIFCIIFGVAKMLGIQLNSFLFKPSDVKPDIPYSIIDENIHELNFNELIEQALSDKNYRYAVRLQYLKSLKVLADKDLIEWKKNKTNHDYLLEVNNSPFHNEFGKLTKTFNYIWYGDKHINLSEYQSTQIQFSNFFKQVNYELV